MKWSLDIRTLYFIVVIINIQMAIMMLYVRRINSGYAPAKDWAIGATLISVGVIMVSFRDMMPLFFSIILGYGAILSGQLYLALGIARAAGRRPPWRAGVFILVLTILVYFHFILGGITVFERLSIHATTTIIYMAYTIFACLKAPQKELRKSFFMVAGLTLICTTGFLLRVIDAFSSPLEGFFPTSALQSVSIIFVIVYYCSLGIMFTLIPSQRLQMELKQQASHDSLTQLLNRRGFASHVERDWARTARHEKAISGLMIDIDNFKQINDHFGHDVGDAVLVAVAKEIKESVRKEDVLARYGGEEFIIMLPDTGLQEALIVAERIRCKIQSLDLPELNGKSRISVSIGLSERASVEQSWENLIKMADQALYQAKQEGRNRVFVA
ncbi:MAG: GGDEF domain-containing protein [Nitrospiria bacterium]